LAARPSARVDSAINVSDIKGESSQGKAKLPLNLARPHRTIHLVLRHRLWKKKLDDI
jgi:hypothetical protein